MHILIIGAGGIGGYYGARLLAAGHDVRFLARGANLTALQIEGLKVSSPLGDLHIKSILASEGPISNFVPDLCVVTVKNYDLLSALDAARTSLAPSTVIMTLQNGISATEKVEELYPDNPRLLGTTFINSILQAPGHVLHMGKRAEIRLGSDNIAQTDVNAIVQLFNDAGIETFSSTNIHADLWCKLTFISALSGVTGSLRSNIGPIRDNSEYWQFFKDAIAEAIQVARSYIDLPTDLFEQHINAAKKLSPDSGSSLLEDLRNGKQTEIDFLSGEIVYRGRIKNIATPTHNRIIKAITGTDVCSVREGT